MATKKTLHVLFTGLVFPKVVTGGDQLFLDIAPRLPKNIKITVITPHFSKEYWKDIDTSNITFKFLPKNPFEFKSNPLLIFLSYVIRAVQTYRILKKEPHLQTIYSCSDIAYADIWPAYFVMGKGQDVSWLTRVYHILLSPKERQGNYVTNAVAYYLQRLSFGMMKKRSTTIFALNKKLHSQLLELGFPKETTAILEAGIDYRAIKKYKIGKKYSYDVAVLGRLTPVKGIYDAVDMWSKVHEAMPDATLAWMGGGSPEIKAKVERQLEERGLSSTFSLLGYVDKDQVYDVMKSAKVFLCPDHENGWGLAVCEAMASGLPVVSYDLDIFGNVYKKGFVSSPLFDTSALADNVVHLLEDPAEQKVMSKDASAQAAEFDHDKVIKDLVPYL